jgi:sRNA-binding protein
MSETPETLLTELCERYPKAFFAEPEAVMPLAIHIHKKLVAAGYDWKAVAESLGLYANAPAYLAALAAGKPRVNLDGEPVGKVTENQREEARAELEKPGTRKPRSALGKMRSIALAGQIVNPDEPQKKPMSQIEFTTIQVKVAFTIDTETFRAALDVDSMGAKSVPVTIMVDGKKYTAQLNPKSFRKAQVTFREATNPMVLISGNLKGTAVESAGIQIFDKGVKAVAE